MGRYYYGDIEGKFWFGVQHSSVADQFGQEGVYYPRYNSVRYNFTKYHLKKIKNQINNLEKELGDRKERIATFFSTHKSYSDEEFKEAIGDNARHYLELYADLRLGYEILTSVQETGRCAFEGEC